jgi:hypothetical protein
MKSSLTALFAVATVLLASGCSSITIDPNAPRETPMEKRRVPSEDLERVQRAQQMMQNATRRY